MVALPITEPQSGLSNITVRRDSVRGLLVNDLHSAPVPGTQPVLKRHVKETEGLQLSGAPQRSGVDGVETTAAGQLGHDFLGAVVVTGDEHGERLAADLTLDQGFRRTSC